MMPAAPGMEMARAFASMCAVFDLVSRGAGAGAVGLRFYSGFLFGSWRLVSPVVLLGGLPDCATVTPRRVHIPAALPAPPELFLGPALIFRKPFLPPLAALLWLPTWSDPFRY